MKTKCLFLLLILLLTTSAQAQNAELGGLVLIHALEIGAASNPDHLFLVDVGSGKITELVVENQSFFPAWVGWSRDGSKFAYLAPARRGINYELWLADANTEAPVPRTPLFNLDLTVLTADWNPQFNIIAVATESQTARDGLYLLNAEFENVVFLREEDLPRNGILDWAHDGYWLAYNTESGALNMVNSQSESVVTLRSFTQPRPALLPSTPTGWTFDDSYYIFSDDIFQNLYAVTTDGNSRSAAFTEEFTRDPFAIQVLPASNRLVALYDTTAYISDLDADSQFSLDVNVGNVVEPTYFVTKEGNLLLNSFIRLADGDYAECLFVDITTGIVQFMRQVLGGASWTHTRCQLLEDGTHFALLVTEQLIPFDSLPDDVVYDLYVVSSDLRQVDLLSRAFLGFERSPLGFSSRREQAIFLEGDTLMVHNLSGESKPLVTWRDLNLRSDLAHFEFYWQP